MSTLESSVIGAVLNQENGELPPSIERLLDAAPESFSDLKIGLVASSVRTMRHEGRPISPAGVYEWLSSRNKTPECPSISDIAQWSGAAGTIDCAEVDARDVWESYQLRQARTIFGEAENSLRSSPGQADTIIQGAISSLERLRGESAQSTWEEFKLRDLLAFNKEEDGSCVLGNRWLCEGGSCLWVGQSGIGKSSAGMQAAITWAIGKPFFGIKPVRPLKSLIIQAENDLGDMAEMMQGVLGSFTGENPVRLAKTLESRLTIIRDQEHVGREFAEAARKLIEKHKPDLVWVDPLLSFFGDDVSNQKACSTFLRNWLNPIATEYGIVWMLLHHTGKPVKDPKVVNSWKKTDFSYMGTGSSELVNWARAALYLRQHDDDVFHLMLTKRRFRAGATDQNGFPSNDVWLVHGEDSICWRQVPPPEDARNDEPEGYNLRDFAEGSEPASRSDFRDSVMAHFCVGRSKAYALINKMIDNGLVRIDDKGLVRPV